MSGLRARTSSTRETVHLADRRAERSRDLTKDIIDARIRVGCNQEDTVDAGALESLHPVRRRVVIPEVGGVRELARGKNRVADVAVYTESLEPGAGVRDVEHRVWLASERPEERGGGCDERDDSARECLLVRCGILNRVEEKELLWLLHANTGINVKT